MSELTEAERLGYGWEQDGQLVFSEAGVLAIVAARERAAVEAALREAADDLTADCDPRCIECSEAATWLRERAARVVREG